jgi:hypothetical protein
MTHTIVKQLRSREYEYTRNILNPRRVYVNRDHTDIRQTFARVRAEMARQQRVEQRLAEMEA